MKIHSVLESLLYNTIKTGGSRRAVITIPYYELAKELGFGEHASELDMRVTIKAEFVDDIGDTDETESADSHTSSN